MMKIPSLSLLRAFSPLWRTSAASLAAKGCLAMPASHQTANFTTTERRQKKKKAVEKKDSRIRLIRYFLNHPSTPRPLRFSRTRYLRHWTIHRAWQLHKINLREQRKDQLQKQYRSMYNACEALRNIDNYGFTAEERVELGLPEASGNSIGRLYRTAMNKERIWDGIPIEYARIQTDTPPRDGWNHGWTR